VDFDNNWHFGSDMSRFTCTPGKKLSACDVVAVDVDSLPPRALLVRLLILSPAIEAAADTAVALSGDGEQVAKLVQELQLRLLDAAGGLEEGEIRAVADFCALLTLTADVDATVGEASAASTGVADSGESCALLSASGIFADVGGVDNVSLDDVHVGVPRVEIGRAEPGTGEM
jgi:hypothetical protein